VRRRGLSRTYATAGPGAEARVQETWDDPAELHASLPDPLEYWADSDEAPARSPFRYLTALRQSPPGIKNFG
jgi:hypothetical protein